MLLHSSKGHLKTPRSGSIAPSPFTQSILPDRNLRRQKKKPQKLCFRLSKKTKTNHKHNKMSLYSQEQCVLFLKLNQKSFHTLPPAPLLLKSRELHLLIQPNSKLGSYIWSLYSHLQFQQK